jgi:hypothetical protein
MESSTEIQINTVDGNNPFTSIHTNVFHYCKVPAPIRQQERAFLHHVMTEDSVDTGLAVHLREYSIELKVRLPSDNSSTLINPTVVIKVQTPTLVGGDEDHPLWDKYRYLHFHGDKTQKHFPSFLEYKTWINSVNKNSKKLGQTNLITSFSGFQIKKTHAGGGFLFYFLMKNGRGHYCHTHFR